MFVTLKLCRSHNVQRWWSIILTTYYYVVRPFEWWAATSAVCIQFRYWNTVLEFERRVLSFVRSLHDADLVLSVQALQGLLLVFALDQTNYSWWIEWEMFNGFCLVFFVFFIIKHKMKNTKIVWLHNYPVVFLWFLAVHKTDFMFLYWMRNI